MIDWIESVLGMHSILDWLVVIAVLLIGVIAAVVWLGLSVRRQFRHHDRDLRAEIIETNQLVMQLLLVLRGKVGH